MYKKSGYYALNSVYTFSPPAHPFLLSIQTSYLREIFLQKRKTAEVFFLRCLQISFVLIPGIEKHSQT